MLSSDSFPILAPLSLAVAALVIWFVKNTALPFGRASRCPKKRSIRLSDGSEVLLLAPDANMTVSMVDAEARCYGYAVVGRAVLEGQIAKALSARKRRSFERVIGRDPDGSVWALDTHDDRLSKIDRMSECDGCLVAVAELARSSEKKPEPAAA